MERKHLYIVLAILGFVLPWNYQSFVVNPFQNGTHIPSHTLYIDVPMAASEVLDFMYIPLYWC